MREILVAVTFRDFTEDANSENQRLFLRSLKKQTYRNFKLIVTIYREKNVINELEKYKLPYEVYYSKRDDCLFSWSEVISNSFEHLKPNGSILIWTNADVVYETNYFEEIIRNFEPGSGGTSYPMKYYLNIEDYKNGRMADPYYNRYVNSFHSYDPNTYIAESIYIDGDIMLDSKNKKMFEKYYMTDPPGIALLPMFGFYARRMTNLLFKSSLVSLKSVMEPGYHSEEEQDNNREIVRASCRERGLDRSYCYESLWMSKKYAQHRELKVRGNIQQQIHYRLYMVYYWIFPGRSFVLKRIFGKILRRIINYKNGRKQ